MLKEMKSRPHAVKASNAGKTFIQILFFFLLFLIAAFPQDRIHRGVIPERHTAERLLEIQKSNAYGLEGLNERESLLSKSKSSNWKTTLRNQQLEFYEAEGFNTKDTRTIINKILLGNGFLLTDEIYQTWDGSDWVNGHKYSYTYDGNSNLTEFLRQTWGSTAWINIAKNSYTYDGNSNLTEELYQIWDGSAWVNYDRYLYTYDINNNQTEMLRQILDGPAWVNSNKSSYTYDVNNNKIDSLKQFWDGNTWVNDEKYSNTYNGNNKQIEMLGQSWNDTAWVNVDRFSFEYDGNSNKILGLYQNWNDTAWVNDWKDTYTYDGNNNLTEGLGQHWDGNDWVNDEKYSYTYDGNDNLTETLDQYWDGAWENNNKYSYTYDGNNNRTEGLGQIWDGSTWVNDFKNSYTYAPATAINEDFNFVNSYSLSNNYPNPFNPSTRISYTIPKRDNVSIKIFNLLGSEVAELVKGEIEAGSYDIEFNAANLPSGIYFYRIQAGNFIDTKEMILLK